MLLTPLLFPFPLGFNMFPTSFQGLAEIPNCELASKKKLTQAYINNYVNIAYCIVRTSSLPKFTPTNFTHGYQTLKTSTSPMHQLSPIVNNTRHLTLITVSAFFYPVHSTAKLVSSQPSCHKTSPNQHGHGHACCTAGPLQRQASLLPKFLASRKHPCSSTKDPCHLCASGGSAWQRDTAPAGADTWSNIDSPKTAKW